MAHSRKRVFIADPKMTLRISKNAFQWKEKCQSFMEPNVKQLIDQGQQVEPRQLVLSCTPCKCVHHGETIFPVNLKKKSMWVILLNHSESQPKPESVRGSSVVCLEKSRLYIVPGTAYRARSWQFLENHCGRLGQCQGNTFQNRATTEICASRRHVKLMASVAA